MFQELSGQQNGKSFHDVKTLTTNGKPKELFFSSDLCAIVEHTKNYLALEDNEICHIKVLLFYMHLLVCVTSIYFEGSSNTILRRAGLVQAVESYRM